MKKVLLLILLLAIPMFSQQDKPWRGNSMDLGGKVECGGCSDLKPSIIGDPSMGEPVSYPPATPRDSFRAEPLTPEEVKELTAAQEQLQRIQRQIRAAHGEQEQFRMDLGSSCSYPGTYSTVELRSGWALISTHPCPSMTGW